MVHLKKTLFRCFAMHSDFQRFFTSCQGQETSLKLLVFAFFAQSSEFRFEAIGFDASTFFFCFVAVLRKKMLFVSVNTELRQGTLN